METKHRKLRTLPSILRAVCEAGNCDPIVIIQPHPPRTAATYKHVGEYIAREHGYPLSEIARTFGVKSHAAVIYAINRVKARLKDEGVMQIIQQVEEKLYAE